VEPEHLSGLQAFIALLLGGTATIANTKKIKTKKEEMLGLNY
jgi:hypothetical protein